MNVLEFPERMAAKDERIGFRVSTEIKADLMQIAKNEGRSLAQVCELLLRGGDSRVRERRPQVPPPIRGGSEGQREIRRARETLEEVGQGGRAKSNFRPRSSLMTPVTRRKRQQRASSNMGQYPKSLLVFLARILA